jgi:peptidoglycan/LPS O-acetylase OafA/YrhL
MPKQDYADRVPELDGVRGLAIIMVLVYHMVRLNPVTVDLPIFKYIARVAEMGWAGVDIFFVLSGFLITSILLRTKTEPGYFKNFYARRILRIFPLYYTTITAIFLFIPLLSPEQAQSTRAMWPWYYLYVQNWGNAFNLISTSFYVGITWSLAIEEQFYLVWPTIVHKLDSKKLAWVGSGLVLLSLGLRVLIVSVKRLRKMFDYNKVFYFSTITRLDSLILGALLAIAFQSTWWKNMLKRIAPFLFVSGCGAIIYIVAQKPASPLVDNYLMYTYGYSLLALTTAALIVLLATIAERNPLRVVFRSGVLRFFGKYSYATYLLHMLPVLFFIQLFNAQGWTGGILLWMVFIALSLGVTILLALLSWHLLEKRVLELKKYFEYQPAKG